MRENPKKCPKCDRYLLKIKTERYDTKTDQNIPMIVGRMCMRCKMFYRNKEFTSYKMEISEIGS